MVKEEVCGIASTQPLFIVELDKEKNQIVLGEEKDLYKTELIAKNFNFQVDFDKVLKMDNVTAKVRYASKPAKVKIEKVDVSKGTVLFDTFFRIIRDDPIWLKIERRCMICIKKL